MLSFLTSPPVPRSNTASHNPVILGSRAAGAGPVTMHFYAASAARRVMRLALPAGPGLALPPLHWHRQQTETFDVVRGRLLAVCDAIPAGRAVVHAGQGVTIPAGALHRFENAAEAGSNEELVVDLSMDPKKARGDEIFFRHFYGYLDDCGRAGRQPNFFQLMLFLWEADTILVLHPLLPRVISLGFVWFTGVVVGRWVLGLGHLYPEYYHEGAAPPTAEPE